MNPFVFDSTTSKAIAAGIVTALALVIGRYGLKLDAPTTDALGVLLTAVVGYLVGHVGVFFAPANK